MLSFILRAIGFVCALFKYSNDKQLSTVRELSIMTAKSHPAAMRFIPDITPKEEISKKGSSQSSDFLLRQPSRYPCPSEFFMQLSARFGSKLTSH